MSNMTMMNNAVDDVIFWASIVLICGVIQMIVTIIQIVMKIKGKDRTEDKEDECKKDEEVK